MVFHLTYLRLQARKVIKYVLRFWKVGSSINIKETTRLLILKLVPKHVFRQKTINTYFLPSLFRTGLIPYTFCLWSALLISRAMHRGSSSPTCLCTLPAAVMALPGRAITPSWARFILDAWKVVKAVCERIGGKRWGLSGIREQPESLVLYFWLFSLTGFWNP